MLMSTFSRGLPTLILNALLNPLAKKPPKGPTIEAKDERPMLWIWKGYRRTVVCGDKKTVLESKSHNQAGPTTKGLKLQSLDSSVLTHLNQTVEVINRTF